MKEIINEQDFNQTIDQNKPVLLDFYADWCGPCQTLLPVLKEVSDELGNEALVAKINVDKNPELSAKFGVRNIPSLFFLKKGEVVERLVGVHSKSVLTQKLNELKNVA